jgi:hypothetical protein
MWLRLLIEHYLAPRGYVLEGEVTWEGEDRDDRGTIFVKDNQVEAVDDLIFNAGPSWAPNHFADDHLKHAIRDLLDSADNTGCSPELTVVAATIGDLSKKLDPRQFVRIHRSSIVNLDQIREIYRDGQTEGTVVLTDGQKLRMSRAGRQKLTELGKTSG